jgi:hypothetical protein
MPHWRGVGTLCASCSPLPGQSVANAHSSVGCDFYAILYMADSPQ